MAMEMPHVKLTISLQFLHTFPLWCMEYSAKALYVPVEKERSTIVTEFASRSLSEHTFASGVVV